MFLRRFHLLSKNNGTSGDNPDIPSDKALPDIPPLAHRLESLASSTSEDQDLVGKRFRVIKPYARRLGDELSLCTEEKVTMKKVHGDGWVTVDVEGQVGVVPMMCLKRV